MPWDFSPPSDADLQDRDVRTIDSSLAGKNIALLICGSIAAYRSPDFIRALRASGANVKCFASSAALYFVTPTVLEWTSMSAPVVCLSADAEHLEGEMDYDLFLVAPATYNSINKLACGFADSVVTTALAAAMGKLERGQAKLAIVPCMNGLMHNDILIENMKSLDQRGVQFMQPRQEDGKNKIPEIDKIVDFVKELF